MYFTLCWHFGEVPWKEYLLKEQEGRIGSNTMEAFALLVLVKNYKACLYKEEKTHQTHSLTKDDHPPSHRKLSIVDKILDGVQFNLEKEASPTVICAKDDRTYKKMEKEMVKGLETFSSLGPCLDTNDSVLKKHQQPPLPVMIAVVKQSRAAAEEELFVPKERAKKRRNLQGNSVSSWGVPSQGERRHKWWSDEGMVAFEKYVEALSKDVEEDKYYVAWEKTYRDVI